jgi:hypothetical protein
MARLPLDQALPMVRRDEMVVRKVASKSMSTFVERLRNAKIKPRCAVIVSGETNQRTSAILIYRHTQMNSACFVKLPRQPHRNLELTPFFSSGRSFQNRGRYDWHYTDENQSMAG